MTRVNIDDIQVKVSISCFPPSAVVSGRLLRRTGQPGSEEVVWSFFSQPLFRLYPQLIRIPWEDCVFDRLQLLRGQEDIIVAYYPDLEHRLVAVKIGDLPPDAYVKVRVIDHREYGKPREAMLFAGYLSHVLPELSRITCDSIELEELRI